MFSLCNKCWIRHSPDSQTCFPVSDISDEPVELSSTPSNSKPCPKCSALHTKPGKFCSHACANSRGPRTEDFKEKIRNKAAAKRTLIEYTCHHCSNTFMGRYCSKRRKKAFCSLSCSSINQKSFFDRSNRIKNPKTGKFQFFAKNCPNCKKDFTAKSREQVTCSLECNHALKRQTVIEKWLNGEIISLSENVPNPIRSYLFELHNSKCQLCGWGETNITTNRVPLTVNHKNGNATDHSFGNLELICPNCHSLTPNYCALNMGKSTRKSRHNKIEKLEAEIAAIKLSL